MFLRKQNESVTYKTCTNIKKYYEKIFKKLIQQRKAILQTLFGLAMREEKCNSRLSGDSRGSFAFLISVRNVFQVVF